MTNMNDEIIPVYVQPANKPLQRHLVGYGNLSRPDAELLALWGILPSNIIDARPCRIKGKRCWLLIVYS